MKSKRDFRQAALHPAAQQEGRQPPPLVLTEQPAAWTDVTRLSSTSPVGQAAFRHASHCSQRLPGNGWIIAFVLLALSGGILGYLTQATTFFAFGATVKSTLPPASHTAPLQGKPAGSIRPTQPMLVAQDTFERPDQSLWGMASDGQHWGADASTSSSFSIRNHMGTITDDGQGHPLTVQAILGPRLTDAEVIFSGLVRLWHPGASNLGCVVRWTDPNNWYKAYIDGTQLILLKKVAGIVTRLSAVPFLAHSEQFYTLRFRIVGSMLMARAWLSDQAEPTIWMVTAKDAALSSGYGGLRLVMQDETIARISLFREIRVRNES